MTSGPDNITKANEYGIDSLKQVITLASGILVLTVTFLKDALGDARGNAILTFLVPVSWVFLFASIPFAWVAIVEAANALAESEGVPPYIFNKKSENPLIKKCLRFAKRAQVSFILGLFLLAFFAVSNFSIFFRSPTPTSLDSPTSGVAPTVPRTTTPQAVTTTTLTAVPTLTITVSAPKTASPHN